MFYEELKRQYDHPWLKLRERVLGEELIIKTKSMNLPLLDDLSFD